MPALNSIWSNFPTSIFTTMTLEARKAGAFNLAQGFPDFDGPDVIKDKAIAAIKGNFNQYAPSFGYPELRQAIANHYQQRVGRSLDPDQEITVFSGATEAIFCAVMTLLSPGDELITFEPFYDSYPAAARAAHAVLKPVPLRAPRWAFDLDELRRSIGPKTRALLLNSPHNPTGRVFSREELAAIADLARSHDLWVITDEVYEELVFEPAQHTYIASLPGMAERTVMISSTSKTFSFTGWKIGYAIAHPAATQNMRALHQFTVFCSASPLQLGVAGGFSLPESYYTELRADYRAKRDSLAQTLSKIGFECYVPQGTYFLLADFTRVAPAQGMTDVEFSLWLTRTQKVACVPISVFYAKPERSTVVRFAFCKQWETLRAAESQLEKLHVR